MTNHKRRRRDYDHPEAFWLMTYRSDDGTETEVVWNSRDGVTPFVIRLRSGKQATHVMRLAVRAPDYTPPPGSRMFVDLTPRRATDLATENAVHWWARNVADCRKRYGSLESFVVALAQDYLRTPGTPDLVEVPAPFAIWIRPDGDKIPGRDA